MSTTTRHYDVDFIKTPRNKEVPVVNGYLFVAKDRGRLRFRCKTRSCKATLLLRSDASGTYYKGAALHNHLPHDELIKEMKHKNAMKTLAKSVENIDVATRTVASNVREPNVTALRLSSDLRFIRRARQGHRTPKVPTDIVFDDESSAFLLYKTSSNDVIVFGDVSMVANATHASHISVDGTFSGCPNTHFQLLTCHAVR